LAQYGTVADGRTDGQRVRQTQFDS